MNKRLIYGMAVAILGNCGISQARGQTIRWNPFDQMDEFIEEMRAFEEIMDAHAHHINTMLPRKIVLIEQEYPQDIQQDEFDSISNGIFYYEKVKIIKNSESPPETIAVPTKVVRGSAPNRPFGRITIDQKSDSAHIIVTIYKILPSNTFTVITDHDEIRVTTDNDRIRIVMLQTATLSVALRKNTSTRVTFPDQDIDIDAAESRMYTATQQLKSDANLAGANVTYDDTAFKVVVKIPKVPFMSSGTTRENSEKIEQNALEQDEQEEALSHNQDSADEPIDQK